MTARVLKGRIASVEDEDTNDGGMPMPSKTRSKPASAKRTSKIPASVRAATNSINRRKAATHPKAPKHHYLSGNALVCGDNLAILQELPSECVDLIYLDPPFNSNHNYVAAFGDKGSVDAQLRDIWRWTVETENAYQRLPEGRLRNAINAFRLVSGESSPMAAYALFMGRRLVELHRVLKPTGSIYLHCDPTANWLLRVLLDAVFGETNFRNEILWYYYNKMHDRRKRMFPSATDTIFFYVKDMERDFFYSQLTEKRDKPVTQLKRRKVDGKMVNARDDDGKLMYQVKEDRTMDNVWRIPCLQPASKERIGYPTQKPVALLERVINASSDKGGLILDPFCGCGTAADAAAKLGRKYLGIDVSAIAVRVMEQRLASRGGAATPVVYKMGWEDYEWEEFERRALMKEADAEDGLPGWAWAEDKVAGLLNAVPNSKKIGDGGVDARYFTEKGATIPIQVKMYKGQIGRPELQKLLGVQTEWQNQRVNAPMALMVTLYPPREALRVYAAQQGRVKVQGVEYPRMQVLSVQEMLTKEVRPKLPPVDPRYFVGDTQTRLALL